MSEPVPGDAGQGGAADAVAASAAAALAAADASKTPDAGAAPKPWYAEALKKTELQGYAENKGWADADAAVESYINLEKMRGVPADRLLTLPENLNDAEAMKPIMAKLGLAPPETADAYNLVTMEGVDPEFAKEAQGWMHEAGLTPKQAQVLAQKQVAWAASQAEAQAAAQAEQNETEMVMWRSENGGRHDAVLESARRAARLAGFSGEAVDLLQKQVGAATVMKAFAKLGDMLGESTFIRSEDKPGFSLSPAGAQSQINSLRADKDFVSKLTQGDTAAKEKWTRLHQLAYPEG